MKPLAPNTLIQNRYLIVQLIGKGGMGEVYLAVDQRLGSAVALKRMLFTDEEALGAAFEREAKTLARLRHPALTKVSDHFTENGHQFLVMEHISGDDLSNRLEQNGKPFPLSWVLFWADQLLDALHYLHSHEPPIIHRDIKPQNLKLTSDNHIILLDFGLAKDSVGETRLSTTGNVIAYTPNYASMEQIRGTGTTARSDIYALSATMYQLLSNIVPADSLSRADSVLNNLPDSVKPLSEINAEVPPSISAIVAKGMNLSAEQRYANAKEMQMALREAYALFQQGTSADTVAFNAEGQFSNPVLQSSVKTQQFSIPEVSLPVGEKTEVMPVGLTNENVVAGTENPVDFNATIPYQTPLVENNSALPPVGEKTEVMPINISEPAVDKTQVSPIDYGFPVGQKTEVFSTEEPSFAEKTAFFSADATAENISAFNEIPQNGQDAYTPEETFTGGQVDFKAEEDQFKDEEAYSPEMTVPLVNYGDQISGLPTNETSQFVADLPINETSQFVAVPQEEVKETPVVNKPIEEPKKQGAAAGSGGGSKMLLIVGVLAVLAFLGIGAAGAGAYFFMPELFGITEPTPKPTPDTTPEPSISPVVTPSEQPTLQAETNTDLGNSTVDSGNSNTSTNTDTNITIDKPDTGDKTPRPTVEKTTQPTQQPTRQPTQQPTRQPTQQPTKPPPTKPPTVKPTVNPTIIK